MPSIPELPGLLVPHNSDQERWLKRHVAALCRLDNDRFPGSQPVSFGSVHLNKLEALDFWVAEKSDGIRVLLLVQTDPQSSDQVVYLIDRHNTYRQLNGLYFPHHEDPKKPLRNSLIDGELVVDVDPRTKQETLRYLAFDCLVVDDQNVMDRFLDKRYWRLQQWMYKPYQQMMRDYSYMAHNQPFEFKVKEVNASYHADKVFSVDIPALQHGNDGLIYTCVNTPYAPGTDQNILKWKPPSENSIDFKLVLRFPPTPGKPRVPDFQTKPVFELHVWCGDDRGVPRYELYDVMYVEDDEWERMKTSNEQLDDRIVEVHWDTVGEHWRMMRFRNDKPNGNHKSVVENIIKSIADGVEKDMLLARSQAIRASWKARHPEPLGTAPPPPPSKAHPKPKPVNTAPPPPPPARPASQPPNGNGNGNGAHGAPLRYARLAPSPWSKVTGPPMVGGMYR